ncbi:MAG: ABC transporter substrate-binding protein [SAR324 cluster bacterium]
MAFASSVSRLLRAAGPLAACLFALAPASASAQKYGGILNSMLREAPAHFSPLEVNTVEPVITSVPAYNNLVVFDPLKAQESLANVIPDLAEKWSTSDGGKRLTFTLRHGVKWQDGKPFTSADVKYTLDLVRGVGARQLRLNPRKTWFWNVKDVQTNGDYEVTVALGAPQSSLLALLASHLMPIVPAHLDPADLRQRPMGTGPFRVKEIVPEQTVLLERNPDYWMKGRPYLDGIRFTVIKSRSARLAALTVGQVDFSFPNDMTANSRDQIKKAVPSINVQVQANNGTDNLLINTKRPPFDNPKVRQALNLALDRASFATSMYQGVALSGGIMIPPPYGVWGLTPAEVAKLPGHGDPAKNLAQARRIMEGLGYGPSHLLKVTVSTRALDIYVDSAVWVVSQLKNVYMDAVLEQIETASWFPKIARRNFQLGVNFTAGVVDDPDAVFFENFACGSERNYSDYCNEEVQKLFVAQSAETDSAKRMALVHEIDTKLQVDVARPILAHKLEFFATWPYVKNLIAHQSVYNYWRFQEVWLDK